MVDQSVGKKQCLYTELSRHKLLRIEFSFIDGSYPVNTVTAWAAYSETISHLKNYSYCSQVETSLTSLSLSK